MEQLGKHLKWVKVQMSLPELFSYVDHICFKPKVRTHDLISNQENAACILRIIPGHLLSRCSKGLEEASCSFPPLVSSVSAVGGVNSDGVLQAYISCQPPRSRRQVQIEEAISGTTEAGPILDKIMNCILATTPFHLSRESPSFTSHHFPWLTGFRSNPLFAQYLSSLLSTEVPYSQTRKECLMF